MRLVLCWGGISGYMAACWRALAALPDIDLHVIAFHDGESFDSALVAGLPCQLLSPAQRNDCELVAEKVRQLKPEILYTTGWSQAPYRQMMLSSEFEATPKWLGVDTPWRGTLRQHLARIRLRSLMGRMARVFVAGERSWQYARRLGVADGRIVRGLYGFDFDAFAPMLERRLQQPGGWPRQFLYVGRYAPEKGIDILIDAYRRYRAKVSDAWPLTCCGWGPLKHLLAGQTGIEDRGFASPGNLPAAMAEHGAFVLPSRYEPWGLVVAEAAAAGLPVICTEAVSASVELVRPYFNGVSAATGDADALCRAFCWMHGHHADLAEMGARGRALANAYSAQAWAQRWAAAARETLATR